MVKKQAHPSLLDSYEQERIPVAQALLNGTDRAFRIVVSDSWFLGLLRTKLLSRIAAFALNYKATQKLGFGIVSQTAIRYPNSSLSKSLNGLPQTAPQKGDRFPWLRLKFAANGRTEDIFQKLADTHFNLVLFGQPPISVDARGMGESLRVCNVPDDPANDRELDRARIPQPSFYLVRPDGYIGLCGARFDAESFGTYISQSLHLAK